MLCTALLFVLRINYFTKQNSDVKISEQKVSDINHNISENKYRYCDIIKITSKYGVKVKKVFYKNNIWDVDGVIHGDLNNVRQDVYLLQQQGITFDICTIKGNINDIDLELQIKIK